MHCNRAALQPPWPPRCHTPSAPPLSRGALPACRRGGPLCRWAHGRAAAPCAKERPRVCIQIPSCCNGWRHEKPSGPQRRSWRQRRRLQGAGARDGRRDWAGSRSSDRLRSSRGELRPGPFPHLMFRHSAPPLRRSLQVPSETKQERAPERPQRTLQRPPPLQKKRTAPLPWGRLRLQKGTDRASLQDSKSLPPSGPHPSDPKKQQRHN
mmetsp:Transcript_44869/g.88540  ORF Transcript_44869/g.88540 Transcript_44869/m.88540 type:complete len:209 (-) Transcript_44869:437-1063(-)